MLFKELNQGKCKTYLIACKETGQAALIDPLKDNTARYLALLAYHRLRLTTLIDTHTHADHRSACAELRALTDAKVYMHELAPQPCVDVHLNDGDEVSVGKLALKILHTPGHTPDSVSIVIEDRVLTGDVLLIRGTGRSDFAGGDAGEEYDSIMEKLFKLPDETKIFPGHDYRGNTESSIGEEKQLNPRVAGKSRTEFIDIMNSLGLPLPEKIQEVLQINQTEIDDDILKFPSVPELNDIRQELAANVAQSRSTRTEPVLLDVRTSEEYDGELGHIDGSLLIPLKELANRVSELEQHKDKNIVVVCRSGVRSTTAAAILTGLGFEKVSNLQGGMLAWNKHLSKEL
ncbi:MAG: rhodanese-like domain-containing protein [Pseudomonadales bacterium]